MRYLLLVALVATLSTTARSDEAPPAEAAAPAAAPAAAAPKIGCDEPAFDFGTADSSQTIEHTYEIKNAGEATLEISNVRPSCGCTVANISERSVPPGGSTKVTARLSLQGRMGQQHKSITVESNDPQQPQFTLTLQGNIANAIEVRPDRVIFQQMGPGQSAEQTIDLVAAAGTTFKVTKAESASPNFDAALETVEDGRTYRVKISTKGTLPVGALYGNIHIETDNPARAAIDIPVSTMVVGELIVAPNEIVLARQPDQPVTRFIVIRPGSLQKFEVEKIEPPTEGITVKVFPFAENGFRIELDNIVANDTLNGQSVRILTSATDMHEISVPFRVVEPGQPM